jgi:MFS family permease
MTAASGHEASCTPPTDPSPWRLPVFRHVLCCHLVSLFGDRVLAMVLGIWMKELTGSTTMAGLVYFAYGLPVLAAPITGWVVDRYSSRTAGIAAQAAGVVYLLPLLIVGSRSDAWIVFAVTVCYGAGGAMFQAARGAILAYIIPAPSRPRANAIIVSSGQVVTLVGPLVGTGLFAWAGSSVVVLIDVASFAISAILLALLRRTDQNRVNSKNFFLESIAGIRFLLNGRDQVRVAAALAVLYSMIGMLEPVIFDVVTVGISRKVEFVSVLLFIQGIGGVLAGLAAGRLIGSSGSRASLRYSALACAASTALFVASGTWIAVLASILLGGAFTVLSVSIMTLLQDSSPTELRGRVMAAASILMTLPQTVAIAAGSGLVAVIPFRWVLTGMTIMAIVAFFLAPCGPRTVRSTSTPRKQGDENEHRQRRITASRLP